MRRRYRSADPHLRPTAETSVRCATLPRVSDTIVAPAGARPLTALVVSDIHAYSGQVDVAPSYVSTSRAATSALANPLDALYDYVVQNGIKTDLLLCCGDICNAADPEGLVYAWERLHRLASAAEATLVATAGNHDLDSRFNYSEHDPKSALQLLDPRFPFDDETASDRYWSRNFAVIANDRYRVVTLNSSAYHGYIGGDQHKLEHMHGRVSEATARRLEQLLRDTERADVNILMCHHHPIKIGRIDLDDYSEMVKGHLLLQVLADDGPWMIVHGHKHFPFLQYAPGDSESPIIFTAGSLSATIFAEAQGHARNQFYLLEFANSADLAGLGLTLAGSIKAWDWTPSIGWLPAASTGTLAHISGFGMRRSVMAAAQQIKQIVDDESAFVAWDAVLASHPELKYILPSSLSRLLRELEEAYKISAVFTRTGEIHQVGPATQ